MTIKTLVFAGNARQARDWADTHAVAPRDYRYIGSPDSLRGYSTKHTPRVFIGSFESRRDAAQILDNLSLADLCYHQPTPSPTVTATTYHH